MSDLSCSVSPDGCMSYRLPWDLRDHPGTASNSFLTRSALPDSHRVSLHRGLAAKRARVSRVLGDFHLLDLFSEGGTISVDGMINALELYQPVELQPVGAVGLGVIIAYLVPYLPVTPTSRDSCQLQHILSHGCIMGRAYSSFAWSF